MPSQPNDNDSTYIEPTQKQFELMQAIPEDRPVTMLNMLRFRATADYSAAPDLAPEIPISGARAYQTYIDSALPHLDAIGAVVIYRGSCGHVLVGPDDERWDETILVRYPGSAAFVQMAGGHEYQAIAQHRSAALLDSRLFVTYEA